MALGAIRTHHERVIVTQCDRNWRNTTWSHLDRACHLRIESPSRSNCVRLLDPKFTAAPKESLNCTAPPFPPAPPLPPVGNDFTKDNDEVPAHMQLEDLDLIAAGIVRARQHENTVPVVVRCCRHHRQEHQRGHRADAKQIGFHSFLLMLDFRSWNAPELGQCAWDSRPPGSYTRA